MSTKTTPTPKYATFKEGFAAAAAKEQERLDRHAEWAKLLKREKS